MQDQQDWKADLTGTQVSWVEKNHNNYCYFRMLCFQLNNKKNLVGIDKIIKTKMFYIVQTFEYLTLTINSGVNTFCIELRFLAY